MFDFLSRGLGDLWGGGAAAPAAPPAQAQAQTGPGLGGFLSRVGEVAGQAIDGAGDLLARAAEDRAAATAATLASTSFAHAEDVDAFFHGKTAAEVLRIKEAYESANPGMSFDARFGSDPARWEARDVDTAACTETAKTLFLGMDGWGTDEGGIVSALRGKSAAEVAEIKRLYGQIYPGRSLDTDIAQEMGGDLLTEAQALLAADPVKSAVQGLENAMSGLGTDEDKLQEILRAIPESARAEVMAQYESKTGGKLSDDLWWEASGSDYSSMLALSEGDSSKADAILLDDAMNGGWTGIGTDEAKVQKILEQSRDPAALAAQYQSVAGESLSAGLEDEMGSSDLHLAEGLILAADPDPARRAEGQAKVAAARLYAAADGIGTDEKTLLAQLEGKDEAERKAIIASFNALYGEEYTGAEGTTAFDNMLGEEVGGKDREAADMLVASGELSDEFALVYATAGAGTNDELLKKTLAGKTRAQIEALAAKAGMTMDDLTALVQDETGGRTQFDLEQALEGTPSTPEEMLERARAAHDFERGALSGVIDVFSDSGELYDAQHARLEDMYTQLGQGGFTDEEKAVLERLGGYEQTTGDTYETRKDAITDKVATGVALVATAAATIATGGAAAGPMMAALTAASGGAASIVTKVALKGGACSGEDMAVDAAMTAIQAGSAGALAMPGLDKMFSGAAGIQEGVKATTGQLLGKSVMSGAFNGGVNGLIGGLTNEHNYDGKLLDFASGVGGGVLDGAFTGVVAGLAKTGTKLGLGDGASMSPAAWAMLKNSVTSMAGTGATGLFSAGMYGGDWEDIALSWASRIGQAGLSGVLEGYGEHLFEMGKPMALPAAAPLNAVDDRPADEILGLSPAAATPAAAAAVKPYEGLDLSGIADSSPTTDDPRVLLGLSMAPRGESLTIADDGMSVVEQAQNPAAMQGRAQAALARMDPDDADFLRDLPLYAENDAQRTMIERAIAAGRGPGDVLELVDQMRGMSPEKILSDLSGKGMWQKFQQSCVPASYQIALAQMDPVAAAELKADPVAAAQEQADALTDNGGGPTRRVDNDRAIKAELAANPELAAMIDRTATDERSLGIDPSKMTDNALHDKLEAASGGAYKMVGRDGVGYLQADEQFESGKVPHDEIEAAIAEGKPIPFSAKGHNRTIVGKGVGFDGQPAYISIDPMTGAYDVIPAAWLDGHPEVTANCFTLPGEGAATKPAPAVADDPAAVSGARPTGQAAALAEAVSEKFDMEGIPDDEMGPLAKKADLALIEMTTTKAGRQALERLQQLGTMVVLKRGGGSYFMPEINTIFLDPDANSDLAGILAHETHHAASTPGAAGKLQDAPAPLPEAEKVWPEEYVDRMMSDEAHAETERILHMDERDPKAAAKWADQAEWALHWAEQWILEDSPQLDQQDAEAQAKAMLHQVSPTTMSYQVAYDDKAEELRRDGSLSAAEIDTQARAHATATLEENWGGRTPGAEELRSDGGMTYAEKTLRDWMLANPKLAADLLQVGDDTIATWAKDHPDRAQELGLAAP